MCTYPLQLADEQERPDGAASSSSGVVVVVGSGVEEEEVWGSVPGRTSCFLALLPREDVETCSTRQARTSAVRQAAIQHASTHAYTQLQSQAFTQRDDVWRRQGWS